MNTLDGLNLTVPQLRNIGDNCVYMRVHAAHISREIVRNILIAPLLRLQESPPFKIETISSPHGKDVLHLVVATVLQQSSCLVGQDNTMRRAQATERGCRVDEPIKGGNNIYQSQNIFTASQYDVIVQPI